MVKYIVLCSLLAASLLAAGCGETVSGLGKDARRIGSGIHKVFIRE